MDSITVTDFYRYETLTEKLERLAAAAPDLVSLTSIGETREGRDIWRVTVANTETGPPIDRRPALLVTANLHATELAGSWVALDFLSHLVDAYPDDERVRGLLDERAFYVVPRVAIDGAEDALNLRGKVVRSRYVEREPDEVYETDTIVPQDLDGDGRILTMRIPDEHGDAVPLEGDDRAMVSSDSSDDDRDRYQVVTEGVVGNYDGGELNDPHYAHVRSDFNRNFPSRGWRPFDWRGHGRYPLSEPETRAVGEFVYDHPNIAGLVDLHTGNPAIFYPRALAGSDPEHPADAELLEGIGKRGEESTGFPYVWGYGEITGEREPDQHLPGSFKDFAYDRLGIPAVIVELGLFYNYLGFDTRDILSGAVDERERTRRLLEYQDEHPDSDRVLFHEWRSFDHPQLGTVEIGGPDRITHGNPPAEVMSDVAESVTQFVLEFAEYRPDVTISEFAAERLESDLHKVSATIVNRGRLATSLTERGRETDTYIPDRPRVDLRSDGHLEFVSGTARRKLDHLEADGDRTSLEWIVRARDGGTAELTVESVRGVFAAETLPLD